MDMGPVVLEHRVVGPIVLEHRVVGPVVPKQEGYGPTILRHKVDILVALGRRGFVLGALGRQNSEPIDPGQEDFAHATAGFDLDPVLARVGLVDMYKRVAAALVGFVVARVDLAVAKFVPRAVEVGPVRVWVERYAKHIASAIAQPTATIGRTDLAIVAGDLAVG